MVLLQYYQYIVAEQVCSTAFPA